MDKTFTEGFIFKKPKEGTPEFVRGNISIKVDEFIAFLQKHKKEDGWVNIDLLKSKEGKLYTALNNYKPKPKTDNPIVVTEDIDPKNIPF